MQKDYDRRRAKQHHEYAGMCQKESMQEQLNQKDNYMRMLKIMGGH